SNGFLIPFATVIARKELHASTFCLGAMSAATGVACILGFVFTGFVKQNRELPVYIWTNVIGRLANMVIAFSLNAPVFTVLWIWSTVFQGVSQPQYGIISQNIYPANKRATLISYSRMASTITTLVSTLLGGVLIDIIGWRASFCISALCLALSTVAMFFYRLPKTETEKNDIPLSEYLTYSVKLLKNDVLNRNIVIGAFIFVTGCSLSTILMPMTQADILNISTSHLGWLNGIYTIVWIVSLWFFGPFIDKKGSVGGLVLSFLFYLFIPVVYLFARSSFALLPAFVILGIYTACNTIAYFAMMMDLSPKGEEKIYQGVNSLWTGARSMVAVLIATFIINKIMGITSLPETERHIILYGISIVFIIIGITYLHINCRKHYNIRRCE
ncbi:MAG: MFS transporter, partial [Armatimonadetes bacterium]|nr:MFS transporter [Candidatus Hippobium faecium]